MTRAAKRTDDQQALIGDVAEKYRHLRETNRTDGPDGLLKSGVCRLKNSNEIEQAITVICSFGNKDPLSSLRERLKGKDIHHFFTVMRDKRLNPFQHKDLETAINETRDAQ